MGKTSLSLVAAIQGAKQGKRVAAITVDPSRRLTSLLGLEASEDQSKSVRWASIDKPIDVFYIEPSSVFQSFVEANMNKEFFEKLKDNGIYKQISQNLRETHNFAALYKTESILSSGQYDLVVLDTPPCHQVVDFFESPSRLQRFFSAAPEPSKKGWIQWVQEKGVQVAESFLKTLVGDEFVEEMDHFFRFVGDIKSQIYSTSEGFLTHMKGEEASLQLVFPPFPDKIQDAEYLNSQISNFGFKIDGFVLNRAFPNNLDFSEEVELPADGMEKSLYDYYIGKKTRSLEILQAFRSKNQSPRAQFVRIPEFDHRIETLQDVHDFSESVNKHWEVLEP